MGLLLVAAAGAARAQEANAVPPSSTIYRRIEAISAFFPVPVHLGLRPASRRAILGMVEKLERKVDAAAPSHPRRSWAQEELAMLRGELEGDSTRKFGAAWRLDLYAANAPPTRIDSNGLGVLDAIEGTFARDRRGVSSPRGVAAHLFPTVAAWGRRFVLLVEPEAGLIADSSITRGELRVHRAFARFVFANAALQVGSDHRMWGQSVHGPLFISEHAAPMPAISVGTDTAITLPWLFRYAGPVQGTLFVADLGPTQVPDHARLAGWQVNIHPWSRFELGVAVLAHTGGNGGPKATFFERVVDLFPAIDALAPQHADLQFSNKIAGGNLRMRLPELSGLDVYYELAIDDFDGRRLVSSMVDDAGHLLGARIAAGPTVLRGEWHRTSLRLYEHAQFRSGLTYRQRLIGNPLGPHARAVYLSAEFPEWRGFTTTMTAGDERRDPSQYTVTVSGERDRGFQFIRISDDPDVRRTFLLGTFEGTVGRLGLRMQHGFSRSWRERVARSEWLSRVELRSQVPLTF